MGTRNITRVVSNGEVKVNQYGQWDGYPTCTGEHILEFIRDNDMKEFKKKVESCDFKINNEEPRMYTGAPYIEEIFNLYEDIIYGHPSIKESEELFKETVIKKFGKEKYAEYLVATRDTGCEILDVIMEYAPLNLYADDYLMMEEPDWQIEALNIVDLDNNEVRMNWHGKKKTIKFEDIPDMDIEKEMRRF